MKQATAATPSPCPCGNDVLQIGTGFLDDHTTVTCSKCGREADGDDREAAMAAWNARAEKELP